MSSSDQESVEIPEEIQAQITELENKIKGTKKPDEQAPLLNQLVCAH